MNESVKKCISIILCFAMIVCCALGCTACQGKEKDNKVVAVTAYPSRIVSGYYISTSVVIALGLKDNLVGIEAKADKRPIYKLAAPELMTLPNTGTAKSFDLEGCIALEPDLVILPQKLKEQAETLKGLGVDVILVNPEDEASQIQMINDIAKATGTQDKAAELTGFIDEVKTYLEKALKDADVPRAYMTGNSDYLTTCGGKMYQSYLMDLAVTENVAKDIEDSYWATVSYEQLLAWDPDVIFIPAEASFTEEDILNDPALSGLKAVQYRLVLKMPGSAEAWDSPVPGSVLGAVWMASQIHNSRVPESEYLEYAKEFYKTFYGFDYAE